MHFSPVTAPSERILFYLSIVKNVEQGTRRLTERTEISTVTVFHTYAHQSLFKSKKFFNNISVLYVGREQGI